MNPKKAPGLDHLTSDIWVIIDARLKFISHSKHVIAKANKIFKKLAQFVRPTWGAHPENVSTIYRQSTQIFTGHGYNKHYLNRFKIIDNESCPCDDISVQDTKHLMQHCPIFANVRFNHEMTCKNLKVNPYKVMELITKEEPKETFVTLINTIYIWHSDITHYSRNITRKPKNQQ
ncbi:hypothetical protein ABMA27_012167 [Loxostege sticticalis]|uniref:Reverse transcriptase n=1 Tax=Loxostege sticticalis TaxID=481309 RepID=A0ABR3IJ15_LOXSC